MSSPKTDRAREILTELLIRVDKTGNVGGEVTDATSLYGEGLQLDSLEIAELSVLLEDEFGTDPFNSGAALPQTVGDVLAFYAG